MDSEPETSALGRHASWPGWHNGPVDPRALLENIAKQIDDDPRTALRTGEEQAEAIGARAPLAEDGETCRLLVIAAANLQDQHGADAWRARSRRIADSIPWPELGAALDMSESLRDLAIANGGTTNGKGLDELVGTPEALAILDRMLPVVRGVDSGIGETLPNAAPTRARCRRWYYENRGTHLLTLGRYEAASAEFATAAVEAALDPRGNLKSQAGGALADYLLALDSADAAGIDAAVDNTDAIAQSARALPNGADLAESALRNAAVMRARGRGLTIYAIA